jgi:cytochrome c peroxidase
MTRALAHEAALPLNKPTWRTTMNPSSRRGILCTGAGIGAMRRAVLASLAAVSALLAACGGGDSDRSAQTFVEQLAAQGSTRRILSVAPGVDSEALLDWAQWRYPELFPKGAGTVDIVHQGVAYAVRVYPGGTYLGVSRQGEIWGLGAYTGGQLQSFGPVRAYAAQVQADRCQVHAEHCAPPSELDVTLRALIARLGLTGDPTVGRTLPHIADAMPQLGKLLFFSKSLSALRDTACASCHHPVLGGGDGLGVSVGAAAANPDLVGPGRRRADGQLLVARNANTFFNIAMYDRALFADGRVQSLVAPDAAASPNGEGQPIRTPDSAGLAADPLAGRNLPAAQARFPITGTVEMRGNALVEMDDSTLRQHIASRLAAEATSRLDEGGWLSRFRLAFGQPQGGANELITFDNIVHAIAEYQRSAVFVKSPWQRYVLGENRALSDDAKLGALSFWRIPAEGGFGCVQCHSGDFLTNERFHVVGFPQSGPGFTGDGIDDGRQRVSGDANDRMAFRTPSLLNVEVTAPYGHAGTYSSLSKVIRHYAIPDDAVADFLSTRDWCRISGFKESANCAGTAAVTAQQTRSALAQMKAQRQRDPANAMPDLTSIANQDNSQLLQAFLESLTDPCVKSRACLASWIPRPEESPDAHQLNAIDRAGQLY